MSESRDFLEALFSEKPSDLNALLWTLPEKDSFWFRDIEAAITCAEEFRAHDLYVGVGLARQDYGRKQRCKSEDIAGIPGLWADIDLRSDAHPKATLPGSIREALSILPPEFPPSIIVVTGNGVHIWWLFREPWIFETEAQRREAAALVYRWQTLLRDNAHQKGWTFERLADLARVLRVPGTNNCKDSANPKPVTLQSQNDCRYNPSEIAEFLNDLGVSDEEGEAADARAWTERFKNTPLVVDVNARIPDELLTAWLSEDPKFQKTWFRQRPDLKDQTQSGYDLALCNFGYRRGLPEQRIVDLIIHHRAIHKQKARTKLDYYQRTLSKAADAARGTGLASATAGGDGSHVKPAGEGEAKDPAPSKASLCRKLSDLFGIEILRILKVSGSEPFYRMDTAAGRIEFPQVDKLMSQAAVRARIAAAAGKLMPRFKPKQWEEIVQAMLDACIVEEGSEELHHDGLARMYLRQYLGATAFIPSIEGQVSQDLRKPMVRDGKVTVCASDFQIYLNKNTQPGWSVSAVASMLSAAGAKTVRVNGRKFKEQGRWELPPEEFDPADYNPQPDEQHG